MVRAIRSRITFALFLVAAFLGVLPGHLAAAAERGLDAAYAIYIGGFQVAKADLRVGLRADCFDIRLSAEPQGIVSYFSTFKLESQADVCNGGEGVVPASYRSDYYKEGRKKRWVVLDYVGRSPVAVRVKPEAAKDRRAAVPAELRVGSLDPISASVAIIEALAREGRCTGERPVYDGRRLFRLTLQHVGTKDIGHSRYAAYAGPATECLVKVETIAGFKKNEIRKKHFPEQIRIFLAEAAPGTPVLPVRMEADYRFGQIRIHASTIQPHPQVTEESRLR